LRGIYKYQSRAIAEANLRSKMDNDEQVRHEFSGAESQSEQRGAQ
jgi:hypothetical protein